MKHINTFLKTEMQRKLHRIFTKELFGDEDISGILNLGNTRRASENDFNIIDPICIVMVFGKFKILRPSYLLF